MKVHFYKRLLAYSIDLIIIVFISFIFVSFIPVSKSVIESQNELVNILSNVDSNSFDIYSRVLDLNYVLSKGTVIRTLMSTIIYILYFMVYPMYNNGQTVGKKIFKIKIVAYKNDLTFNNLIIRGLLLYGMWYNLVDLIIILFLNKNMYFKASSCLQVINSMFILISVAMVLIRKDGRGLHDIIGSTVVKED